MLKQPTKYEIRREKLILNILEDLYNFRALTTEQISRRFGYSMRHTYRLTQELREDNLTITESVKGYIKEKPRQGDYHRIAAKGINLLNESGFETSRTRDQLRVSKFYLPYLLSLNEIIIRIEKPLGWKMINGRDVKARYELNNGDIIHGMLVSPEGKEYAIYIYS